MPKRICCRHPIPVFCAIHTQTPSTGVDYDFNLSTTPSAVQARMRIQRTNSPSGGDAYIAFWTTGSASLAERLRITERGGLTVPVTITAGGTTGDRTIDKVAGSVNIAAAGTTVTVTNALVTANSIVLAVPAANDSTALVKNVVPTTGSFTINMNAAVTAETRINWFVIA